MAKMAKPQLAAAYCRISQDRGGEELGVQRQEREVREWAESHGWSIAEVYTDDDISASNGKHRPGFRRMLQDIANGHRDGLLAWHQDRIVRRGRELEELVDLVAKTDVPVAGVHSGDLNLATGTGRLIARTIVNFSTYEVEHMGERIMAKQRELAEAGMPKGGGRRPFGYRAGGMEIEPTEAKLVVELVDRVLAGEGLRTIARDWDRRGVRPVGGGRWKTYSLRRLLGSGRISGQRVHQGRVIGPAAWPAIIDPDTAVRVRSLLNQPSRLAHTRDTSPRLLTGMLRCGVCGAKMSAHTNSRYYCLKDRGGCNKVGVAAAPVEAIVVEALLTNAEEAARRPAHVGKQRTRAPASGIEAIEERNIALTEMFANGDITRAELKAGKAAVAKKLEAARARVVTDARSERRREIVRDGASLRRQWEKMPIVQRRVVLDSIIESITIAPSKVRGGPFNPERVQVRMLGSARRA